MLLRVKSSVGLGAALLLSLLAACSPRDNPPNTPSAPSGPDTVTTLGHYYYSAQASDPDGDSIAAKFIWDDTLTNGWTAFVPGGSRVPILINVLHESASPAASSSSAEMHSSQVVSTPTRRPMARAVSEE